MEISLLTVGLAAILNIAILPAMISFLKNLAKRH